MFGNRPIVVSRWLNNYVYPLNGRVHNCKKEGRSIGNDIGNDMDCKKEGISLHIIKSY